MIKSIPEGALPSVLLAAVAAAGNACAGTGMAGSAFPRDGAIPITGGKSAK
jgi:hypothetical protein